MQLFDAEGRRLYCTEEERRAFVAAAAKAPREVRTFCGTLHATGCRISEALALTARQIDLSGRVVVFESLKKRRRGVFRAVPVPPELLDTLDMVHGIREAQRRGQVQALLWPWSRMTGFPPPASSYHAAPATISDTRYAFRNGRCPNLAEKLRRCSLVQKKPRRPGVPCSTAHLSPC